MKAKVDHTSITRIEDYRSDYDPLSILKYDPKQVLHVFAQLNWGEFGSITVMDGIPQRNSKFSEILPEAVEVYETKWEAKLENIKYQLPWTRGTLIQGMSIFLSEFLQQREPIKEYRPYGTSEYNLDCFYFLQYTNSRIQKSQEEFFEEEDVVDTLLGLSFSYGRYLQKPDIFHELLFGKFLIDELSKKYKPIQDIDDFVREKFSVDSIAEFYLTYLSSAIQLIFHKSQNPMFRYDKSERKQVGIDVNQVTATGRKTTLTGDAVIASNIILDMGENPRTGEKGSIILDFILFIKSFSRGLANSWFFESLVKKGVSYNAFTKEIGLITESYVRKILNKAALTTPPSFTLKTFDDLKVNAVEFTDVFLKKGDEFIIGEVKTAGFTKEQEKAASVLEIMKGNFKDFIKLSGLKQLRNNVLNHRRIFSHFKIPYAQSKTVIHPALIFNDDWLYLPSMTLKINVVWNESFLPELLKDSKMKGIVIAPLSIRSVGDLSGFCTSGDLALAFDRRNHTNFDNNDEVFSPMHSIQSRLTERLNEEILPLIIKKAD